MLITFAWQIIIISLLRFVWLWLLQTKLQLQLRPNTPTVQRWIGVLCGRNHNARMPSCPSERHGMPPPTSGSVWARHEARSSQEVRKRRDILELYSTTIKQLQGPQLRSYMLLLSHVTLLLSFILLALGTLLPPPHVLTQSPLWISSHTSVLPLQTKQLGNSWNRTSRWNDSNNNHQWDIWQINSLHIKSLQTTSLWTSGVTDGGNVGGKC